MNLSVCPWQAFQFSLIFVGKAGAYLSEAPFLFNIRNKRKLQSQQVLYKYKGLQRVINCNVVGNKIFCYLFVKFESWSEWGQSWRKTDSKIVLIKLSLVDVELNITELNEFLLTK